MSIKALLFDLDGTLVEFPKSFLFQQARDVFSSFELEIPSTASMQEAFSEFDFFSIAPAEIRESFIEQYWKKFDWGHYPKSKVFPYTVSSLREFSKAGFQMAIVTSRDESSDDIEKRLEGSGVMDFISFIEPRRHQLEWSDKSEQIACLRSEKVRLFKPGGRFVWRCASRYLKRKENELRAFSCLTQWRY